MISKKNKILIILLVTALILSAVAFSMFYKKSTRTPETPDKLFNDLNLINKDLAVGIYNNDATNTAELISNARQAWLDYSVALKEQTGKNGLPRNKEIKIIAVTEHMRKADELKQEGNIAGAYKEIKLANKDIADISGQKLSSESEIDEKLLDFYSEIKKIHAAKNKKEAESILPDLKLKFTVLKGFSPDREYDSLIAELEQTIATMDKSLGGTDFENARDKLEPLFIKLYNKY